nr:MAG TPA: hypothetical protein [Caudoviricetes sp.]
MIRIIFLSLWIKEKHLHLRPISLKLKCKHFF